MNGAGVSGDRIDLGAGGGGGPGNVAAPWGSARDGRAAGTLAGPGPKPPQRRVWRTMWLCLGGAASANRSAALAEPLGPRLHAGWKGLWLWDWL